MLVFFDIDTQRDFLNKDGRLYVKGTTMWKKKNLKKLILYAIDNNIPIVSTMDTHTKNDKEFIENGGKFPEHCIHGSYGWKKIRDTDVSGYSGLYVINKNTFDMFSNPETDILLSKLDFSVAVVFGVATDYCIKAAVLGLLERKKKVYVVADAIKGVSPAATIKAIREMTEKGTKFVMTEDILKSWLQ